MSLPRTHCVDLANGKFAGTHAEDLKALFAAFSQDPRKDRLVVHFHGGLVSQAAGTKTGERLLPLYEGASGYPVFFVWRSGLVETIGGNLGKIVSELVFRRMRDLLMQFVIGKAHAGDGDRAVGLELPPLREVQRSIAADAATDGYAAEEVQLRAGAGTLSDTQQELVFEQLRDDAILQQEALAIASTGQATTEGERGVGGTESRATLMDPEVVQELQVQAGPGERGFISTIALAKRAAVALAEVLARFANGRDHGLYPTVVEELLRAFYLGEAGQIAWREMKQDTADAFGDDPAVYGGTAFLQGLRDTHRDGNARTILVGHSTGAVYICHFLEHADALLPPGQTFDVVLLAPACTFDLFDQMLEQRGHRIANLRIFTMQDTLERADRLVPAVYTRSLLYFVSGVVEGERDAPILGMQRFYAGTDLFKAPAFPAVQSVRDYLDGRQGRVIWSQTNDHLGWSTTALTHGDFDNDQVTLDSVAHLVKDGFA